MRRVLLIPAAGRGSRLGASVPKVLVPVAGRPMLDWLADLYRPYVQRIVLVLGPDAESTVLAHCDARHLPVASAIQEEPTGMLDAIVLAAPAIRALGADRIWITWCDQVALLPATIARLSELDSAHPEAALIFPTARRDEPYTHFDRDASGRIVRVRQRREGDALPAAGESDAGLFSLSRAGYDALGAFGGHSNPGHATAERNFLPFVPWISASAPVITFSVAEPIEAVGVNTPEELRQVEAFLRERGHA
jgi:bifunctional UDP-N-acetylglucosamine pyrophosphorylase/glucosamine-1-phosphate N-acetyltransferase